MSHVCRGLMPEINTISIRRRDEGHHIVIVANTKPREGGGIVN